MSLHVPASCFRQDSELKACLVSGGLVFGLGSRRAVVVGFWLCGHQAICNGVYLSKIEQWLLGMFWSLGSCSSAKP